MLKSRMISEQEHRAARRFGRGPNKWRHGSGIGANGEEFIDL
jgi:hypothetical protein